MVSVFPGGPGFSAANARRDPPALPKRSNQRPTVSVCALPGRARSGQRRDGAALPYAAPPAGRQFLSAFPAARHGYGRAGVKPKRLRREHGDKLAGAAAGGGCAAHRRNRHQPGGDCGAPGDGPGRPAYRRGSHPRAGNLAHIYHNSLLYRFFHSRLPRLTARERERLLRVDPITYAERNRPRHVLMIQAARDFILPPRDAVALWQALGRPPIRWLDTNHYAPLLAAGCIERASAAYLRAVWSQEPAPERRVPGIYAPTLKLGLLMGLDSNLTFGLQWQALTFAARSDHMSLLHADIG